MNGLRKIRLTTDRSRKASGQLMKIKGSFTGATQFKNTTLRTVFFVQHGRGSNLLEIDLIRKDSLSTRVVFLRSLNKQIRGTVLLKKTPKSPKPVCWCVTHRSSISVEIRLRPDAELMVFPTPRLPIFPR